MGNYFTKTTIQKRISESDPNCVFLYKTQDLIKIIEELDRKNPDKKELKSFLEMIPGSSNYLIQNELKDGKIIGKVIDVYERHGKSYTQIEDHIALNKLTDKCFLGLFKDQKKQLDELIDKKLKE